MLKLTMYYNNQLDAIEWIDLKNKLFIPNYLYQKKWYPLISYTINLRKT